MLDYQRRPTKVPIVCRDQLKTLLDGLQKNQKKNRIGSRLLKTQIMEVLFRIHSF